MSHQCKPIEMPLNALRPKWIKLTSTKGVLRCLRQDEDRKTAQGMIFWCPRCAHDKNKQHFCILLFEDADVPEEARPHGRFIPNYQEPKGRDATAPNSEDREPADFEQLSLWMLGSDKSVRTTWLAPGDIPCRWSGTLSSGKVVWRPRFGDRS